MESSKLQFLTAKARQLRDDAIEMIGRFGVGHIGGVMSVMDALTVLYYDKAKVDPANPDWQERDRIIMSKGHAGPAMYVVLGDLGFYPREWEKTLNQNGTHLPSHCDRLKTPGIDMTAGSLGQGLSVAVGMAEAARLDGNPATIYCIIGDGESQEGQIWEASMYAGSHHLDNLIVMLDYNKMQLDGKVADICDIASPAEKWKSFGFDVQDIDGNDIVQIADAIDNAKARKGFAHMIVLNTVKGKGASFAEAAANCHSMSISEEMWRNETGRLDK